MHSTQKQIKHWGNRYTFLDKIGSGAFGTAYKVKDMNGPEGQESIKVLKEIYVETMDKDEIDECAREAKLLSKLNNPYIVQYLDSFCYLEHYCIITEFCEGKDLNRLLVTTKENGCHLAEKRILRWFIQIIQGLDYIHKRKILHRDLKPCNIFLKADSVKIGDFGISRILNFTMDMASTFLGTPYYMSPEVLKHDGYNTTSDVWSAGVILYEMCSLEHAFKGNNIMTVMVKILAEPIPKIPSMYTEEIQHVIKSILIKDPTERPSANDVLELPFIKNAIKDPWIDIAANLDLSETAVARETKDISNYLSQSVELKILPDVLPGEETVVLTPKEKLALKKRLKAEKEAEAQKQFILETYQKTQETKNLFKQRSSIDSLPFAKMRYDNPKTSISEYEELSSLPKSGVQTMKPTSNAVKEKYEPLSHTENICAHFKIESKPNIHGGIDVRDSEHQEEVTLRASGNHKDLYNIKYSDLKFDDPAKYNIITYDEECDPFAQEVELKYDSDFESEDSVSESGNSEHSDGPLHNTIFEKFQDDDNTDPFGKSQKLKKIYTMEKKCLEKIDEVTLQKAFRYLERHYYTDNYLSGLRKICKSDDVASTVGQLFFLKSPTNKEVY